jgi:hypothetical protein
LRYDAKLNVNVIRADRFELRTAPAQTKPAE